MSLFDVLARYGALAFLRFVVVGLVFALLHLVRWPLLALVLVVEAGLRLLDRWAARPVRFGAGVGR